MKQIRSFHTDGTSPNPKEEIVFVFGSNLAGRHGAGAALCARQYFGAVYGVGIGRTGKSYAIPTKDRALATLQIAKVRKHIAEFHEYASARQVLRFFVTRIGCGLAGFKDEQIAPHFKGLQNCDFPEQWREYLE